MSYKDRILKSPQLLTSKSFRRAQISKQARAIFEQMHPSLELYGILDSGAHILTYSKDQCITPALLSSGQWQREQLMAGVRVLEREALPLGGRFFDVGANIGTQTVYSLQSGAFSSAVAIEPDPDNLRLLKANMILNGLEERVTVVGCGAGSTDGDFELEKSPDNFGDHRIVVDPTQMDGSFKESKRNHVGVKVRTLDNIIKDLSISPEEVSLVWVDTQGFEGYVLEGAASLMAVGAPFLMELWPYGLRRSGSAEILLNRLSANFSHFYDMADGDAAISRPIGDVTALFDRLANTADHHTDILVLR